MGGAVVVPARRPRRRAAVVPAAVAVGASTGGPRALAEFLRAMGALALPVFVVQHLPASFVPSFVTQLSRASQRPCRLGEERAAVRADLVYVAPGDRHMVLEGNERSPRIRLRADPPEHHCRPAVDPLFRTAATVFGPALVAVVLTGMGCDGLAGAREVVRHGGVVLAQDRESSVVWGMPGAVVNEGLATRVGRPEELARWIREAAARRMSA